MKNVVDSLTTVYIVSVVARMYTVFQHPFIDRLNYRSNSIFISDMPGRIYSMGRECNPPPSH
jgi:hypothetical protein